MPELIKAKNPFIFSTRLHLTELLGRRASTLPQLLQLIKEVPGASIYHHTHRFLQQHLYLSPEPPNDFAWWVAMELGENILGERLSSIDTIQYTAIRSLREKIIAEIEDYLTEYPVSKLKFSRPQAEFHFMKSISFIIPTKHVANDLQEFSKALKKITIDSIYFHIFEARLRLEKGTNDFSNWLQSSLDEEKLAKMISQLDPYTYTLEDLRITLIKIVERRLKTLTQNYGTD